MLKSLLCLGIVLSGLTGRCIAQQPTQSDIVLGTSFTYILDPESASPTGEDHLFQEYTWNLNAAYQLRKRWRIGLSGLSIVTKSPMSGHNRYWLAGVFSQFQPLKKVRIWLESGLFTGNYCTCGAYDTYRRNGRVYLDLGFSGEIKLFRRLDLDLGFNGYQMLNRDKTKYGYTQYIIGLNYRI